MSSTGKLLHEIITTGDQTGVENMKILNEYRDLISEEAFEKLEDIAIGQIISALINH